MLSLFFSRWLPLLFPTRRYKELKKPNLYTHHLKSKMEAKFNEVCSGLFYSGLLVAMVTDRDGVIILKSKHNLFFLARQGPETARRETNQNF